MTYAVVFDVSQRIPQFAIGILAALAIAGFAIGAVVDVAATAARWPVAVVGGAVLLIVQWLAVDAWPYALGVAAVLGVVLALSQTDAVTEAPPGPLPRGARRLVVGCLLLGLAVFQGLPMVAAIDLARRLDAGEATVVEGPIAFQYFGKTECLTVEAYRSCYGEAEVTPGWNRQHYAVGGIDAGAQVRIAVLDGLIVRVEVATAAP